MSAARVITQRRLSLAVQVASGVGIVLTIGCAIALASEDDNIAAMSLILALTILRSLAHLWTGRCLREPELDARRLAIAVYFVAVVAQCLGVASVASWLVPVLIAWPVTLASLLARRDARWLVIADPPLPAFVIRPNSYH